MIKLSDLPKEHHLRNTPLGEIEAKYRWKQSNGIYRTVRIGAPKLVNVTYNELGVAWTSADDWFVDDWDEARIDIVGSNGNNGEHYEI